MANLVDLGTDGVEFFTGDNELVVRAFVIQFIAINEQIAFDKNLALRFENCAGDFFQVGSKVSELVIELFQASIVSIIELFKFFIYIFGLFLGVATSC